MGCLNERMIGLGHEARIMPALILRKDERLEAVECPAERSPEIVAREHRAELVDYCNSLSEPAGESRAAHPSKLTGS
jgi:hypothetical protein